MLKEEAKEKRAVDKIYLFKIELIGGTFRTVKADD